MIARSLPAVRGGGAAVGKPFASNAVLDRLTDIRLSGDRPSEYNQSYMVRCLSYLRPLPGIRGR
ncbi:hypothetical protein BO443_270026 [Burkholderia orbicola]